MSRTANVSAGTLTRVEITIPAAAGTASPISTLAGLSETELARVIGCKICAFSALGVSRAAFVAGESTTSLLQYVPAGEDYYEPSLSDAGRSFVKAASGAAITATAVFYRTGSTAP